MMNNNNDDDDDDADDSDDADDADDEYIHFSLNLVKIFVVCGLRTYEWEELNTNANKHVAGAEIFIENIEKADLNWVKQS